MATHSRGIALCPHEAGTAGPTLTQYGSWEPCATTGDTESISIGGLIPVYLIPGVDVTEGILLHNLGSTQRSHLIPFMSSLLKPYWLLSLHRAEPIAKPMYRGRCSQASDLGGAASLSRRGSELMPVICFQAGAGTRLGSRTFDQSLSTDFAPATHSCPRAFVLAGPLTWNNLPFSWPSPSSCYFLHHMSPPRTSLPWPPKPLWPVSSLLYCHLQILSLFPC